MSKPTVDPGIPVLTEVYDPQAAARPAAKPEAPTPPQRKPSAPDPRPAEDEWERLERQVTLRILHQILGRVDFVLEQRIRDELEVVLRQAVGNLAGEIRQGLQQSLEEVIARAVSQEIDRLQSIRK
jgi:hypothetical protein